MVVLYLLNIVVALLLSRRRPNTSRLSADRWRVYSIKKQGLRIINSGGKIKLMEDEYDAEHGQVWSEKDLIVEE